MDQRQTRGLIALFAVLNIFCWYIFTKPTSLWLAEQGLQSEAPPPPDIVLTQGFSRAVVFDPALPCEAMPKIVLSWIQG